MRDTYMLIMTFVQVIMVVPMALLALSSLPGGTFYGYLLLVLCAPYYIIVLNCLMNKTSSRRRTK